MIALIVYLLALACWTGTIVFFSFVIAPAVCGTLALHDAGNLMSVIFPQYYVVGYVAGLAAAILAVVFTVMRGARLWWGATALLLAIAFLIWPRTVVAGQTTIVAFDTGTIGVLLLVFTMLLSFTGYLLPWDQLALWAVTVGTNMMGYTPVFGSQVRFVLLGGVEIGRAGAQKVVGDVERGHDGDALD